MRWIVLSLTIACGKTPAPAPLVEDADVPSPCAIVESVQRAAMKEPGACVLHAPSETHVQHCVPTRDGAWGLVIDAPAIKRTSDCRALAEAVELGMASSMSVAHAVHVDAHGRMVRGHTFEWDALADVRAFDYDGDGNDELLVTATTSNAASVMNVDPAHETFGLVLRSTSAEVERYLLPKTASAVAFDDVDADGRPDLVTRDRIEGDDGDVSTWIFFGPRRFGHSLRSGDFSFDDAVASSSNARECASISLSTASARTLFAAALCARDSGRSLDQIRRDWVARCRELARVTTGYADGVSLTASCRADIHSFDRVAMPRAIEDHLK